MSRKLNKQQQRRVDRIQQEKQRRADRREASLADQQEFLGPEENGLVIAHYGAQLDVEPEKSPGSVIRCMLRANLQGLVTGDQVVFQRLEDQGVVVAAAERHSVLNRADNFGRMKTVAANIDSVMIVIAPEPEPFANLVDRYLVVCELNRLDAVIILNKSDQTDKINKAQQLAANYQSLGYPVLKTSAADGTGIDALKAQISNKTIVFVGQSGVGKSSLVNALSPDAAAETGALSPSHSKGTHTTTTARLFHLANGGKLIDSPGIREVAMWHISPEELAQGFIEFHPFIGHCRFRDCQHREEPGCAIQQAAKDGKISTERMQSYQFIRQSLESEQ